jgi:3-oxoacyl-[acyl-carrier-protein] synthase III
MLIESVGVYLPERQLTTDEIVSGCVRPLAFPLEQLTGIRKRHVAAPDEFSLDLARHAAEECLRRSHWAREDIDLVVCCNISRLDAPLQLSVEPSSASRLTQQLGLDPTLAFDVNNACAGMFTGLYVARTAMQLGLARNALVVSGEHITPLTRTAQREIDGFMDPRIACLTVGDAGAALLVEPSGDPEVGFRELELCTLGRYSPYCIAKLNDRSPIGPIMFTDTVRLTAAAVRESIAHARGVQERGGWPSDWFQHVIPHQTSKTSLTDGVREAGRALGDAINLTDKVISVLEERGNTATTSHSVVLMDAIHAGRIKSGDRLMFRVAASGLTVGTAYYVLDDLPERVLRDTASAPQTAPIAPRRRVRRMAVRARVAATQTCERSVAREDSTTLATLAAQGAIASWNQAANRIGLVVHAGMHRTDFLCEPAVAALIAGRLQINDVGTPDGPRTFAFDVLNGAVGFLNACELGAQFISARKGDAALIATAEIGDAVRIAGGNDSGFLDSGAALVLEASESEGFGAFTFRTLSQHTEAVVTTASEHEGKVLAERRFDSDWTDYVLDCAPEIVNELLEVDECTRDQVTWVIAPKLSERFLTQLADRLHIPLRRFVDAGDRCGSHYTSHVPRALSRMAQREQPQTGELGLIFTAGSGLSVGCATYFF